MWPVLREFGESGRALLVCFDDPDGPAFPRKNGGKRCRSRRERSPERSGTGSQPDSEGARAAARRKRGSPWTSDTPYDFATARARRAALGPGRGPRRRAAPNGAVAAADGKEQPAARCVRAGL